MWSNVYYMEYRLRLPVKGTTGPASKIQSKVYHTEGVVDNGSRISSPHVEAAVTPRRIITYPGFQAAPSRAYLGQPTHCLPSHKRPKQEGINSFNSEGAC